MLPLVNDSFLTLKPYVPGKPISETERELGIRGCIKLASNENPYGPSPKAVEAIKGALAGLHDYPDGGAFYLRQALADKHRVDANQIIIGNGSNELLDMVVRTCVRPGENVLFANPSFIVYKLVPQASGLTVRDVPLTSDMRYDLPAIAKAVDERTKLVFVGNPNNPTGTYLTRAELDEFFARIPQDVIVVMDEAYCEYAVAPDYPNGLDYLSRRERVLVLRTFSKCYGLAGLRVGYGMGNTELVAMLNRCRQPFNVNSLALVGAIAALTDEEHVATTVRRNRSELTRLVSALRGRGLTVYDSQANFVLVDFKRDGEKLFSQMLKQGVIVRPVANYGLPTCLRITIGKPEQNDRLLETLDRVLAAQ